MSPFPERTKAVAPHSDSRPLEPAGTRKDDEERTVSQTRSSIEWSVGAGLLALLLGSTAMFYGCRESTETVPPARSKPPGVAAQAGGLDITDAQVDEGFARLLIERPELRAASPAEVAVTRRSIAEGLAIETALLAKAATLGIAPTGEEVEGAVAQARAVFGSETAYRAYLDLRKLTDADFADTVRRNLAIDRLFEKEVIEKNPPTEVETEDFYARNKDAFLQRERWRLSEVFVPFGGDEAKALAQITAARLRIDKGEAFEEVAREISSAPSAAQGGDVGYLQRGQVYPGSDLVEALKPGQTTPPIKTPEGFRMYRCVEQVPAKQRTLDDPDVLRECRKQLRVAEIQQYISAVKAEAKVEVF